MAQFLSGYLIQANLGDVLNNIEADSKSISNVSGTGGGGGGRGSTGGGEKNRKESLGLGRTRQASQGIECVCCCFAKS